MTPSSHTASAFVAHGNWSDESRKHPALRFVESLGREFFDAHEHSRMNEYYTEESTFVTPHAEHMTQNSEPSFAYAAGKFFMDPLSAFSHEPYTMVVIEGADGHHVHFQGNLFANIAGTAMADEKKVADEGGKHWDVKIPIFYDFDLVKVEGAPHDGLKIRSIKFMKDTGVVNHRLHKRGHGHKSSVK